MTNGPSLALAANRCDSLRAILGAARSSDRRLLDEFLPTLTILPLMPGQRGTQEPWTCLHGRKGRAINPGDNLIAESASRTILLWSLGTSATSDACPISKLSR
jgi:hypothetical protein